MFCRQCGTQIPDDSQFCSVCGTRIVIYDATKNVNEAEVRHSGGNNDILRTWNIRTWNSDDALLFLIGSGFIVLMLTHTSWGKGRESGIVILLLVIFLIFVAFTDKGWTIPVRVAWVFGCWICHSLLSLAVAFILGPTLPTDHVESFIPLIAAIPFVIWGTYRSKTFHVEQRPEGEATIPSKEKKDPETVKQEFKYFICCPSCDRKLYIPENLIEVTCKYCGTSFHAL